MAAPNEHFPEIGKLVDETDKQEEHHSDEATANADEERAVQEIESLCMRCYEQVRRPVF